MMGASEVAAALPDCGTKRCDRVGKLAAAIESQPEFVMSLGEVLVLRDRGFERSNRQIELLLARVDSSELVMCIGIAPGPQGDRGVELFRRVRHATEAC